MNFIRSSFSSGSFRRKPILLEGSQDSFLIKQVDSDACFETYKHHCVQLEEAITSYDSQAVYSDDLVLTITSHLEHLVSLVEKDIEKNKTISGPSACLDHFLSKNIVLMICRWSFKNEQEEVLLALAQSIDSVLAAAKKVEKDLDLLRDPSFHQPISKIFKKYEHEKNAGKSIPAKFETILVSISYYVCVFIVREPSYLDLFYDIATHEDRPKFPMMTLLICNLHRGGAQGQTSRDNLKLLIALAKEQQLLAQFIALHSDLCPIVATGLTAVFSDLPHPLPEHVERAGMLSAMDVECLKEVEHFVTSLEFCDSILETSSWLIASRLLDMCFKGFLVPVLGPALFQNTMKEIFAATCYLTLMIRRIRNRGLIGIFVRFLLVHTHEDKPIIEFLVSRILAQSELRLATLNLFHALINLDCEDVILVLAMRYLLPCTHVMLSQSGGILQESDTNCLWAAKFLSFVPTACSSRALEKAQNMDIDRFSHESEPLSRIRSWSRSSNENGERRYGNLAFTSNIKKLPSNQPSGLSDSLYQDYTRLREYLDDGSKQIRSTVDATRQWRYRYDGSNPQVKDALRMLYNPCELEKASSEGLVQRSQLPNQLETKCDESENEETLDCSPQCQPVDPSDVYVYCVEQLNSCLSEMKCNSASSPGQSSGYYSINFNLQSNGGLKEETSIFSKEVQDDLEFWSLMRDDDFDETPIPPVVVEVNEIEKYQPNLPTLGPFLENLVKSIDGWLNNSIEVNLALCSIVSRLATYSHPLLRSLILNPYLILQPSIPSLAISIATLKQRIDSALRVHENSEALIDEARTFLKNRLSPSGRKNGVVPINNKETKQKPSKFAGIFGSFIRKDVSETIREESSVSIGVGNNQRSIARKADETEPSDPIGSHVAVCAILLEEWLLELAALCMEHAVQFTPFEVPITQL